MILCLRYRCPLVAISIQSMFAFEVRGHTFKRPFRPITTRHSCTRLALVYPKDYTNKSSASTVDCRRVHERVRKK